MSKYTLDNCKHVVETFFNYCVVICAHENSEAFNPMVAICSHIIVTVTFKVLIQNQFIGTCMSWVKCISARLTGAKSVSQWVDFGRMGCEGWTTHTSDIHPSLQLALRRVN
jgi:hypothetical protein